MPNVFAECSQNFITTSNDNSPKRIRIRIVENNATATQSYVPNFLNNLPTAASYTPHPLEKLVQTALDHIQNLKGVLLPVDEALDKFVDELVEQSYSKDATPLTRTV